MFLRREENIVDEWRARCAPVATSPSRPTPSNTNPSHPQQCPSIPPSQLRQSQSAHPPPLALLSPSARPAPHLLTIHCRSCSPSSNFPYSHKSTSLLPGWVRHVDATLPRLSRAQGPPPRPSRSARGVVTGHGPDTAQRDGRRADPRRDTDPVPGLGYFYGRDRRGEGVFDPLKNRGRKKANIQLNISSLVFRLNNHLKNELNNS